MGKAIHRPSDEPKTARFGVYLDLETRKELLKAAIDEGVSATQLVEQLIRQFLAQRKRQPKKA